MENYPVQNFTESSMASPTETTEINDLNPRRKKGIWGIIIFIIFGIVVFAATIYYSELGAKVMITRKISIPKNKIIKVITPELNGDNKLVICSKKENSECITLNNKLYNKQVNVVIPDFYPTGDAYLKVVQRRLGQSKDLAQALVSVIPEGNVSPINLVPVP